METSMMDSGLTEQKMEGEFTMSLVQGLFTVANGNKEKGMGMEY